MIGFLTGQIAYTEKDSVILDVSGVGYVIHVSERTLMALPPLGEVVTLYTDLLVREDLLQLFGFLTPVERAWHRLLISVQGVGAKASLAILGTLGEDGVARAITLGDANAIKMAPGIGPKIASRVVNELKDKAPNVMVLSVESTRSADMGKPKHTMTQTIQSPPPAPDGTSDHVEAISALSNLGYTPADAARAVTQARDAGTEGTGDLIKAALRMLAPHG